MDMPYPYSDSYVTPHPSSHYDLHPQPASDHHQRPHQPWYGSGPAASVYSDRPSASSSLAGALDERASKRRPHPAFGFPENEVMPVSPMTYGQPMSYSQVHAQGYSHHDSYHPYGVHSAQSPHDEVMDVESYMPPEPMAPSVYGAYTNAPYSAEFETGYLNGQLVSTGVGYQSTSPTTSQEHRIHAPLPPPPIDTRSQHPFPLTISYTLAGAITPIEDRKPLRSPKNAPPQSPCVESTPSPDAMVPLSNLHDAKHREDTLSASATPTPPPPNPATPSVLYTKFPTKVSPYQQYTANPRRMPSADSLANSDAGVEGLVDDVKGPSPSAPAKKKPAMACLFCRERKICCGPPTADAADQRCKQCIKRNQACTFPTECRRGQHKRTPRKAALHALAAATFPEDLALSDALVASSSSAVPSPTSPTFAATLPGKPKPKPTTRKEKAAAAPKRARSRDAKTQVDLSLAAIKDEVKIETVDSPSGL